jgi:hypothetical protein
LVDFDRHPITVRPGSDVTAAFDGTPVAGGNGETLSVRVLVVALPRDHRVQEVAERVGVLDRADGDVTLERPQSDLDHVACRSAVTAGETVTVLRPELRRLELLR